MGAEPVSAVFYTRYAADRGSSRARAFEYLEPLARIGVPAVAVSRVDERGMVRPDAFEEVCERARCGAVVVVHKPNLTFRQLDVLLAASDGRLVVDFDDAIWMGYGPGDPADGPASLEATLRSARFTTTGSRYLAVWARRVSGRDVVVLPPSLDLSRYPRTRRRRAVKRPIVGWVGSAGNYQDLAVVRDVLCALVEEGVIRFRVISDQPLDAGAWPEAAWVRWSFATEVASLAECDVGIMPLADDDDALRAAFGNAGRAHVEARHSLEASATSLAALLRSALIAPVAC